MTRVRIAGPRARLDEALAVVQDVGALHVAPPRGLHAAVESDEAPAIARVLGDAEAALRAMGAPTSRGATPRAPVSLARATLFARRTRRRAQLAVELREPARHRRR